MKVVAVVFVVVISIILGFLVSSLIVTILMDKICYDSSLELTIAYIRKRNEGRRCYIDEIIAREAAAVNIQMRLVFTLLSYALVALAVFAVATQIRSLVVLTGIYASYIGIFLNCLVSLIFEASFYPTIARYEGFNKENDEIYLEKIAINDNDNSEKHLVYAKECAKEIKEIAVGGDLFIFIEPVAGDIIYGKVS